MHKGYHTSSSKNTCMHNQVPLKELEDRMKAFYSAMDEKNPDWEYAAVFGKINLYYLTGTMQDGVLLIPRGSDPVFWVRNSYERALDESLFCDIRQMKSFRNAASDSDFKSGGILHTETELVPVAHMNRFLKHFPFGSVASADRVLLDIRSVKSGYEISLMKKSGEIHRHVTEDVVPEILREGMTEAGLGTEIYSVLVEEGHQGIVRFGMFGAEMRLGHIGFGENSIYPSFFDGASGNRGMGPYAPVLGSSKRKLKRGDLIYLDVGCGFGGYHTDKTMTYMFKEELPEDAVAAHKKCVEIHDDIVSMLSPGKVPSDIYRTVTENLDEDFKKNFMGYKDRQVKFLGHGIGLLIDEMPVIAKGFDEPLRENMTMAVEPKKGIAGVGMVGTENTHIITPGGGRTLTGKNPGLIFIP